MPRDNVNVSYCFYNDIGKFICANHTLDGENLHRARHGRLRNLELQVRQRISGMVPHRKKRHGHGIIPCNWEFDAISNSTIKTMREDIKFFSDNGIHGIYLVELPLLRPKVRAKTSIYFTLYLFQCLI